MGDKTIPDSAEPRLESFYPPFVAGIDLPHQGVVDSYNPYLNFNGATVEVSKRGPRIPSSPRIPSRHNVKWRLGYVYFQVSLASLKLADEILKNLAAIHNPLKVNYDDMKDVWYQQLIQVLWSYILYFSSLSAGDATWTARACASPKETEVSGLSGARAQGACASHNNTQNGTRVDRIAVRSEDIQTFACREESCQKGPIDTCPSRYLVDTTSIILSWHIELCQIYNCDETVYSIVWTIWLVFMTDWDWQLGKCVFVWMR